MSGCVTNHSRSICDLYIFICVEKLCCLVILLLGTQEYTSNHTLIVFSGYCLWRTKYKCPNTHHTLSGGVSYHPQKCYCMALILKNGKFIIALYLYFSLIFLFLFVFPSLFFLFKGMNLTTRFFRNQIHWSSRISFALECIS